MPYLASVYDGPGQSDSHGAARSRAHLSEPALRDSPEAWIRASPPAYCNTADPALLARVLPGFDQETRDFYRWRVAYTVEELADLIGSRLAVELGPIRELVALARGPSGRIYRLKVVGERDYLIIGKDGDSPRPVAFPSLTARPSWWTRSPMASLCTARVGDTASACARLARRSWPIRARLTSRFFGITIVGPPSASEVGSADPIEQTTRAAV